MYGKTAVVPTTSVASIGPSVSQSTTRPTTARSRLSPNQTTAGRTRLAHRGHRGGAGGMVAGDGGAGTGAGGGRLPAGGGDTSLAEDGRAAAAASPSPPGMAAARSFS